MTQAIEKKIYTTEEYLTAEIVSQERHEYLNGEIRLMTGGTPEHNKISGNLFFLLRLALGKQPYEIFFADQRLLIRDRALGNSSMRETPKTALPRNIYTYPDIMVLEKPIQLQENRSDTVINPCLIAEVLSKSTKDYDRSEKFLAYRTIETFQEYLLIDQYQIHVEHYVKTGVNKWLLSEYTDPQVTLSLSSVNLELNIADLYENIEFIEA